MSAAATIMGQSEAMPLSLAPPQDQQIGWLNAVQDHPARYVALFFACVRSIGVVPYVAYQASGRHLSAQFPMQDDTDTRSRRMAGLIEHVCTKGMRQAVMNDVEARGLVCDERNGDPIALRRAIRDFLAIGSNIHIRPDGGLSYSGGMPAGWGNGSARSNWIENCTRSYLAILDLPGMSARIERIVRRRGQRQPSGFIVLERATAA